MDETVFQELQKLRRHIALVREATELLGSALINDGEESLGIRLIANGHIHDNSKFYGIEWDYLVVGQNTNSPATEEQKKLAIIHHQTTNMHHPEYWGSIDKMSPLYIYEMVCDWYARSTEFGTDLREWIKEHGLQKYDISPHSKYNGMIKKSVDSLLQPAFKPIRRTVKADS